MQTVLPILPIVLLLACSTALAIGLLAFAAFAGHKQQGDVERMPYESGMDPIHDTRRRFDVRFYLLAIAFLVFDVELLFLYPWAVASGEASAIGNQEGIAESSLQLGSHHAAFVAAMIFLALLTVGLIYDWRKGVFRWR